ncbi:DUF4232 domain-containing protein [Streptomyces sp. NPDC048516]|uniref:DUF4232 domain-containing protein n=1 Tax=Streptomyces sp. NPDC048516 TaxID=3365565 RepID=UPI003714BF77
MSSSATVRTARRRRTLRLAAAALTAAAGLTLTACSGSDAAGAKPAGRADAGAVAADTSGTGSSTGAQSGSDAQADSGAKTGSDAKAGSGAKADATAKQSGGAHATGGGKAGSGLERCHTSGLKASFATGGDATPDPNAGGATTTSVVLTNKGSHSCVIGGFPGVDLTTENGGGAWSRARSSAKHSSITLQPGDSTDFTINVALTKEEKGFWQPAHAVITPPNETTALTLDWPWGALVDQRGATHPATFVNPIG